MSDKTDRRLTSKQLTLGLVGNMEIQNEIYILGDEVD